MFRNVPRRAAFVCALILAAVVVPADSRRPAAPAPRPKPRLLRPRPAGAIRLFDFGPGPVAQALSGSWGRRSTRVNRASGPRKRGHQLPRSRGGRRGSSRLLHERRAVPFIVDLPEGNYRVTVTLGDPGGDALTTVRAESGGSCWSAWRPPAGVHDAQFHRQHPPHAADGRRVRGAEVARDWRGTLGQRAHARVRRQPARRRGGRIAPARMPSQCSWRATRR